MPTFQRDFLESEINKIYEYETRLIKLKDFIEKNSRIIDFGCAGGYESLALMWILNAEEVVGVDRDITDCEEMLNQLKIKLVNTQQALPYAHTSPEDRNWWKKEVPIFLKENNYPVFIQGDISKPINIIPDSDFDLAYCSNVLNHVFTQYGIEGLKNSAGQMKRVTKSNGFIVASEPNAILSSRDRSHIDFESIFIQEGLKIIKIERNEYSSTYVTRKI